MALFDIACHKFYDVVWSCAKESAPRLNIKARGSAKEFPLKRHKNHCKCRRWTSLDWEEIFTTFSSSLATASFLSRKLCFPRAFPSKSSCAWLVQSANEKPPNAMEVSEQHNSYHYLSEDDFVYQNFIWLPLSDKSGLGKVSRVIWDWNWKGFEKRNKK